MSPSAIIRSQARKTLKGNYVAAVSAFVILLLPLYIVMGLDAIIEAFLLQGIDGTILFNVLAIVTITPLTVVTVVLLSPLFNGYIRLFYQAALTQKFQMSELFYYFESGRYVRTLHLNLALFVRLMLPALLFFLPVFIYHILCFSFMQSFTETVLYKDFAFILTILSAVLLILYSLKYFLVLTLYCVNGQTGNKDLFNASKTIMKEQRHAAAQLIFSFTPWFLLCLLILPALYVVPYFTQSLCIGAKWMTLKGN